MLNMITALICPIIVIKWSGRVVRQNGNWWNVMIVVPDVVVGYCR